jgi:general secretion pathway protein D
MSASKAAEFGFQWQGLIGSKGDRYGVAAGTNFGGGGNNIVNLSVAGGNTSGTASTLPGTGLNIGLLQKINGVYTLASLARFLETVSGTNILSTPNLVSLDNEEAKIVVGKNVPFVTGSFTNTGSSSGSTVNPFQTVERKDVGITLRVRPQIGEGGAVRMTIYQEKSSVDQSTAGNQNGPTTTKSSIESNVVVDDGQILVLGGQLTDQYDDGQSKVPGLGDVPLFGNLFRSETRSRDKTNLLVFLRPVVLRDGASAQALTLDRYDAIRAQQQQAQPQPNALLPIDGTAVLPPVPGSVRPATAPSPATVPQSSQP